MAWLEEALRRHEGWHLSSLDQPSALSPRIPVSLRVIAARSDTRVGLGTSFGSELRVLVILCIFPDVYINSEALTELRAGLIRLLSARLRNHAAAIPFWLVSVSESKNLDSTVIHLKRSDPEDWTNVGAGGLGEAVHSIAREAGVAYDVSRRTPKARNKQIVDALHAWSREHVSSDLIVNDIDAFYAAGPLDNPTTPVALVEFKRSSVVGWQPYLDDLANYGLMRRIASAAALVTDVTIHYDVKLTSKFRCNLHILDGLTDGGKIRGRGFEVAGASPEDVAGQLSRRLGGFLTRTYESGKRRS